MMQTDGGVNRNGPTMPTKTKSQRSNQCNAGSTTPGPPTAECSTPWPPATPTFSSHSPGHDHHVRMDPGLPRPEPRNRQDGTPAPPARVLTAGQNFADVFAGMQDLQHSADYDPTVVFTRFEATAWLALAEVICIDYFWTRRDERAYIAAPTLLRGR